jgi:PAP2 superfamily
MDHRYARMAKLENQFRPGEEGREGMSDQNARTASRSLSQLQSLKRPGFNLLMVYAGIVLLFLSVVGCRLTSVNVPNAGFIATTLAFMAAAVLPFALYLQEKGLLYIRDAVLVILWSIFLTFILNFPVVVAARLGLGIGLQDAHLAQWDKAIGVSVPGVTEWAKSHWLGLMANKSYFLLFPLMRIAILLPTLCGRVKHAQQFLLANVIAFALGLPIFSLLPAVGPWYGYHLAARPDQVDSQALLLLLRQPGPCEYHLPAGIICFPSFHVIWAILCVQALWGFRWLRIPAALFSGAIILSTVTTGEHYFCDVLAGAVLAAMAILASRWLMTSHLPRKSTNQSSDFPESSGPIDT